MAIQLRNRRRWAAAFAAVALQFDSQALCAVPSTTPVEPVPPQPMTQARVVVLIQSASPEAIGLDFLPNLRWQLAELELTLLERTAPAFLDLIDYVSEAEKVTGASDAFLVAWITRRRDHTNVYLYDPKGPHLYARDAAVSESPAAASEELALILRSAIQARLDGGDLAMAEIALPKPAVPLPPSSPRPLLLPTIQVVTFLREPRVAAEMTAVVSHPIGDANWQGGLGLRMWARVGPVRFGLGYSVFPGLPVSSSMAEITVQRHPMEAFVGYRIWTSNVNIVVESALSSDPIRRETTLSRAPLVSQAPSWHWLWAVAGRLRFEVHLFSSLWLTSAAGAEFPLNPYAFELSVADQRQSLARILPVRPTLELGLVLGWR